MPINTYEEFLYTLRTMLPLDETFDLIERPLLFGDHRAAIYYLSGMLKDEILQEMLSDLLRETPETMKQCPEAGDFIRKKLSYVTANLEKNPHNMAHAILSGQTVMLVEPYNEAIIIDLRTYPVRSIGEPEKEKSLRGAKDGFVETMLFNVNLIRRRVRDPRLVFQMHNIGSISRTDVCIVYMKGIAPDDQVKKLGQQIDQISRKTLTLGDQSLIEALTKKDWWNPFPRVRYTQRPDVVSAHLTEGKFAVLVDNSPTAILIPAGIFDYMSDVDDYYFPVMTGNYFRLIRMLNMLVILFLPPVFLLIADGKIRVPEELVFLIPEPGYAVPIFWQFLLLEFAIDGLKLASLNTPSSLGMSLSVIGALILGQFSIDSGWLIPQTILCMATVALASFSQPGIELGYAIKFMRMSILILSYALGLWGLAAALILDVIVMASTKTLTGNPYLSPLIPFHWKKLKRLLLRSHLPD